MMSCTPILGCRRVPEGPPVVILENSQGVPVRIRVEVMTRPEEQAQGLMNRRHLDPDAGMLFAYPVEQPRQFWMKNTFIPLDMVFIGANRRIVGVVREAQPLTLDRREVDALSQFVLEVNGGFLREHNILPGSRVQFEGIEELRR